MDIYVIEHKNILSLRSYELRDYIKELRNKEKREGLTFEEEEYLERAINEREMRKKSKAYKPGKDEQQYFEDIRSGKDMGMNTVTEDDVIRVAKEFDVDQSDLLETFLCELLGVSVDKLYELMYNE